MKKAGESEDPIAFQGTSVKELKKGFEESVEDDLGFCEEMKPTLSGIGFPSKHFSRETIRSGSSSH